MEDPSVLGNGSSDQQQRGTTSNVPLGFGGSVSSWGSGLFRSVWGRSLGGRSVGVLQEHDGEVITELAVHVTSDNVEDTVERLIGLRPRQRRCQVEQRQESTCLVAGLAEPVGVQQQPIARTPRHRDRCAAGPQPQR